METEDVESQTPKAVESTENAIKLPAIRGAIRENKTNQVFFFFLGEFLHFKKVDFSIQILSNEKKIYAFF